MFGIPSNDEDEVFDQIEDERRNGTKPIIQPRTHEEMAQISAEKRANQKPFWNLRDMDIEVKNIIGAFIFGFVLATVLFYH